MVEPGNAEGTNPTVTIFLSYARADRRRAERLATALGRAGLTVWWDALIEGGAAFSRSIRDALDAADAVVVLWSPASVDSDWVRDEAAQGRDRHRLVPLSVDAAEPPLGFRQYHTIDLSGWRGRADAPQVAAIVRAVAAVADRPTSVAAKPIGRPSRRGVLLLGSGGVLAAAGAGTWLGWRRHLFGADSAADSIAILPFRNLGGDRSQGFFSDGLTAEFRAALARNDSLKVIAGTSSQVAGAAGEDPVAIARTLAVAFVLDGSVQRSGDVVRIVANLTDGRTGYTRWSQSFDRRLADIFAVQTEIAGLVARKLAVQIATTAPAPGGTTDVAAYEAYLRGRSLFDAAKDEPTDRAALAQYEQAIAADPGFALAHAGRSRSLAAIAAEYATAAQLRPLYDAAIAAAHRAVGIAPDLAEAQLALGYAQFIGRLDVPGAREPYDRAYALGHGDADILLLFALYAVRAGRGGEAVRAIDRALALDPLNPRTHRAAGSISYALRRYAAGIGQLTQALTLNPAISNARSLIGNCLYQTGRVREARDAYAAEPHDIFRLTGLAIADHRLGDAAGAGRHLAALVRGHGDSVLYQQAEILAQWGAADRAFDALRRARRLGDSGLLYLATDPMLDPLQGPTFAQLVDSLHLRG